MTRKEIKYWTLIILLSYGPTIGLHLLVRPMWFNDVDSSTNATMIEMFFTIILLPIYLIMTNYLLAKSYNKANIIFILNGIIILTCICLSTELHFKNWNDGFGREYADHGTEAVMNIERSAGILASLIGLIIIYFRLRSKINTSVDNEIK